MSTTMARLYLGLGLALLLFLSLFLAPGYPYDYTSDQLNYMPTIFNSLNPALYPDSPLIGSVPGLKQSLYDEMLVLLRHTTGLEIRPLQLLVFVFFKSLALLVLFGLGRRLTGGDGAGWLMLGIGLLSPWVYGTELRVLNHYLAPRMISTGLSLACFYFYVENAAVRSVACLIAGAFFHPLPTLPFLGLFGLEFLGGLSGDNRSRWSIYAFGGCLTLAVIATLRLVSVSHESLLFYFETIQPVGPSGDLFYLLEWHPGYTLLLFMDLLLYGILRSRLSVTTTDRLRRFNRLFYVIIGLMGLNLILADFLRLNLARVQLYRSLRYLKLFLPLLLIIAYRDSSRNLTKTLATVSVLVAALGGGTIRMVFSVFASAFAILVFFPDHWIRIPWLKQGRRYAEYLAFCLPAPLVVFVYWQYQSRFVALVVLCLLIGTVTVTVLFHYRDTKTPALLDLSYAPVAVTGLFVVMFLSALPRSAASRSSSESIQSLCKWVHQQTEPNTLIYYDPADTLSADYVRVYCRRSVFFSRKIETVKLINRHFQTEWNRRSQLVEQYESGRIELHDLHPKPDFRLSKTRPAAGSFLSHQSAGDTYYLSPVRDNEPDR